MCLHGAFGRYDGGQVSFSLEDLRRDAVVRFGAVYFSELFIEFVSQVDDLTSLELVDRDSLPGLIYAKAQGCALMWPLVWCGNFGCLGMMH